MHDGVKKGTGLRARVAGSWRDAVDCTPEERALLPRGYDVIGHVVLVRLPDEVRHLDKVVGEALLAHVPQARTAATDAGVEGDLRTRRIEVLAGDAALLTEHRESGLRLTVDLATCYYSPRLAGERLRIADLARPDERVLDLTAGVGPLSCLLAKRGCDVVAVELNAQAARLARANARSNRVADRVAVVHAEGRALARSVGPVFDRVVVNLPHEGEAFLEDAASALRAGGLLRLGCMLARDTLDEQAVALADRVGLTLQQVVHVRNYNPAVWHVCLELRAPGG